MVVYIGSHSHRLSAILFDTGQLLWEITLGDRIESSACVSISFNRWVSFTCFYKLFSIQIETGAIW
jgi:acyl-CoA synthetase